MLRAAVNEWGPPIAITTAGVAAPGAVITPGNDAYGTYVQLLSAAQVTDDAYGIWICINSVAVSAVTRNLLANIGADPGGGTAYQVVIPDLLGSCAGSMTGTGLGGIWYYFPLGFRAGTSLACQMSVHNATVGTGNCFVKLVRQPSQGVPPRVGSYVRAFGVTSASSSGTAVTPNGAGSKSAYVQLGTIAAGDVLWSWCGGIGCDNSVMSNNQSTWDFAIGSASNKRIVISDQLVIPTAAEVLAYTSPGATAIGIGGDGLYVRAGGSASSPTGMSAIMYGVGG